MSMMDKGKGKKPSIPIKIIDSPCRDEGGSSKSQGGNNPIECEPTHKESSHFDQIPNKDNLCTYSRRRKRKKFDHASLDVEVCNTQEANLNQKVDQSKGGLVLILKNQPLKLKIIPSILILYIPLVTRILIHCITKPLPMRRISINRFQKYL